MRAIFGLSAPLFPRLVGFFLEIPGRPPLMKIPAILPLIGGHAALGKRVHVPRHRLQHRINVARFGRGRRGVEEHLVFSLRVGQLFRARHVPARSVAGPRQAWLRLTALAAAPTVAAVEIPPPLTEIPFLNRFLGLPRLSFAALVPRVLHSPADGA